MLYALCQKSLWNKEEVRGQHRAAMGSRMQQGKRTIAMVQLRSGKGTGISVQSGVGCNCAAEGKGT